MKKIISFMILLAVAIGFASFKETRNNSIYDIDNSAYSLSISEPNISPLKDTVFGESHCLIARCPLTLTNNTNDTLKYAGMSASWWDYYLINNKNFALAADYWNVFKNGPVVYVLPPHRSMTKSIKIITTKDYFRGEKLRIALRLKKVTYLSISGKMLPMESLESNLIWSNEVTIH